MSTKHLTYLDSLRGLAALTVVLSHFIVLFWIEPTLIPHGYIIGELAVCLFFILSGFVLSQRFLGTSNMKWAIMESIIKRPFRLLGVVWATVILGTIISIVVQGSTITNFICKTWTQYTIDFFISPFATGQHYNGVLWTIGWELWGSMLVFGIVLVCNTLPKYLRLVIFSGLFLLTLNTNYGFFIVGMIIADLHKNYSCAKLVEYRNLVAIIILCITVITSIMFYNRPIQTGVALYLKDGLMAVVALGIFLFTMLNTIGFRSVLNWKPVNFLGNVSYGFYAIHYLVMKTVSETINVQLGQYMSKDLAWIGMVVISLPIIVFAAWVVDTYIDKPSIRVAAVISKWTVVKLQSFVNIVVIGFSVITSKAKSVGFAIVDILNPDEPNAE